MMAAGFPSDHTVLPDIPERKGTLYLRSNYMKYGKATLNSNWDSDREADPKDYDINNPLDGKRDLLKGTYERIGNTDEGFPETTVQESTNQVYRLNNIHTERLTHRPIIGYNNFITSTQLRETGMPERGHGSILPRHSTQHGTRHFETTQKTDYQDWSPKTEEAVAGSSSSTKSNCHRRVLSEFTDRCEHRRTGVNTWQDSTGIH